MNKFFRLFAIAFSIFAVCLIGIFILINEIQMLKVCAGILAFCYAAVAALLIKNAIDERRAARINDRFPLKDNVRAFPQNSYAENFRFQN